MSASHAPGPWTVRNKTVSFIDHGKRYAIARVSNSPLITGEGHEANARLIAAAPDLLDALRDLESAVSHYFRGFEHLHPSIERPLWAARKVLDVADDAPSE